MKGLNKVVEILAIISFIMSFGLFLYALIFFINYRW